MNNLKDWLENQYLNWQRENGLISLRKWADVLGISYTNLMGLISGDRAGTTMQTAYQIGERLGDFSILGVLGYPVPDAPLIGLADDERAVVLAWLESVKVTLDGVPHEERMVKLSEILAGLPDADIATE